MGRVLAEIRPSPVRKSDEGEFVPCLREAFIMAGSKGWPMLDGTSKIDCSHIDITVMLAIAPNPSELPLTIAWHNQMTGVDTNPVAAAGRSSSQSFARVRSNSSADPFTQGSPDMLVNCLSKTLLLNQEANRAVKAAARIAT